VAKEVIMSFMDLIRRGDKADRAFDDLQSDMAEAFEESMALEPIEPLDANKEAAKPAAAEAPTPMAAQPDTPVDENQEPPAMVEPAPVAPEPAPAAMSDATLPVVADLPVAAEPVSSAASTTADSARRLTSHSQTRLAALESFDKLHRDAQEHLQDIESKITEVVTSQRLTRRFFNILLTDIHRANDLELANTSLGAEQKKLTEQLAETSKRLKERDGMIDGLRQREASLLQDNEALRTALATARMELVEAANAAARDQAKLGEALKALSARAMEVDRTVRETEVLREKHVALSVDLDKALKREAEALRKAEEIGAIQANDAVRYAEMRTQLSRSEKEVMRLQTSLESAQMRLTELEEAAIIAETDREDEAARRHAESNGLRSEMQALQARLATAADVHNESADEIARLRTLINDAAAEKMLADERMAALAEQHEKVKLDLSAANANISQLVLRHETEQIQLDIQRQECEDLKAEMATLNARIKELLPFERLYKATKAREAGEVAAANGSDASVVHARPASRRPTQVNRGRTAG
jgi:chromosome segregation ATPase